MMAKTFIQTVLLTFAVILVTDFGGSKNDLVVSAVRHVHRHRPSNVTIGPSRSYRSLLDAYSSVGKSPFFGQMALHNDSDGITITRQFVMNNNRRIPMVGFGTWQLGNASTVKRSVENALDAGYRLIDTAYLYDNEETIGDVIKDQIFKKKLKREDLFVTTKVWSNFHSKPRVLRSIRSSLKKLKLKYLDLVLIHYPTGFKDGQDTFPAFSNWTIIPRKWSKDSYLETWQAMEEAVRLGLTRSIGVSNFNRAQMRKLLEKASIKPVINQVESHPNLNQRKMRKYLLENQILLQAYAPLRRGDRQLLENPTLQQIGKRHRKTAAQIALRWQLDRTVPFVVKSSNQTRIWENIDIFDFRLSKSEMTEILSVKQKDRIYNIPGIKTHPDYPFNER